MVGGDGDVEGVSFTLADPDAFVRTNGDEIFPVLLGGYLRGARLVSAGVALVFDVQVECAPRATYERIGLNGKDELIKGGDF